MKKGLTMKTAYAALFISALCFPHFSLAKTETAAPPVATVTPQIFEKAKDNTNWKTAFATGYHGQIVFMNITPMTNPKNEIGSETHLFDQIILVVQGNGKADLNGKTTNVNAGDMIFIPKGTVHNVINLNRDQPLKIISFYSSNDIPANSSYKTKNDEPKG